MKPCVRAIAVVPTLFALACDFGPIATSPPLVPAPVELPVAATTWLRGAAVTLGGDDPSRTLDDLEPLRAMVGNARLVSLGEGTHGTREFFRTKHRILQFLVERMGFNAFAIEATWPEAERLNTWVRTGAGSPDTLLSGLYFWTWNTREVYDMLLWMRQHNARGGNVGFYGVDMQYPGMAIENVIRYVRQVDPSFEATVTARLSCMARHANNASGRFPSQTYSSQLESVRAACAADLAWVREQLVQRQAAYEQRSSPAAFALALQSARSTQQYDDMYALRRSRDGAMADNTEWLLTRLGPGAKVVLWAHNFHVSTVAGAMGSYLRESLGRDMLTVGFSHGGGTFTAVGQSFTGAVTGLGTFTLPVAPGDAYELFFGQVPSPMFALDLRNRAATSDSTRWLHGPLLFRRIGATYSPEFAMANYWYYARLPAEFDVMIHFGATTPSRLLPFKYPASF